METNPSPTQSRASQHLKHYLLALTFIATFGLGIFAGQTFLFRKSVSSAQSSEGATVVVDRSANPTDVNFQEFWTVWDRIKQRYVKDGVKDQDLFYGSMEGLVSSLDDPHSEFFPPKQAEQFSKDLSGEFEGIGAEIGIKNDQLIVISPLADSPAEKAGLLPGDKILAIDKEATAGMDTITAVGKIRGAASTTVTLLVLHEKQTKPVDITIVRAKIIAPSLVYSLKNSSIAYIRITQFNPETVTLLEEAIAKFPTNLKGIIVDVRNNPGGYLNVAVYLASKWVKNGDLVVEEKGRVGILESFTSQGSQPFGGLKTIVLINKGSASASEILAGALQDYKLATIIGETSFGKGSVQDLETFPDGSALKLTIAEWFTPLGRNINKEGIKPDIEVKEDWDKEAVGQDSVLNKAIQLINASTTKK